MNLLRLERRVYRGERLGDGNYVVWFEDTATKPNGDEPARHPLPLHGPSPCVRFEILWRRRSRQGEATQILAMRHCLLQNTNVVFKGSDSFCMLKKSQPVSISITAVIEQTHDVFHF
ncbi:MAG: hypothetical protein L0Z50_23925 [Verrucomicrobiales bacterium]|nr:hypothetical protein [Verrucomicrobiales bacterium]